MEGLQLEQPRLHGKLGVQAELANLVVVLAQAQRAALVYVRGDERIPAGAVEHAQAKVERPDTVAVAGGEVHAPLPGGAFV